jgi:hypothetical protein
MNKTHFEIFLSALESSSEKQGVLGDEWVIFPPNPDYGYESTPRNALTFGTMGVDGVHYAILTIDGAVRDDSAVILISPMDFSDPCRVLSDSFLSYLANGCGASPEEMEVVFAKERAGKHALVPFLKKRFDQSLLWGVSLKLQRCLDLIERKS